MVHFNGKNKGEFLEYCEELFKTRYTNDDKELQSYLSKPAIPPPVIKMPESQAGQRHHHRDRHNHHHSRDRNNFNRDHHPTENNDRRYEREPRNRDDRYGGSSSRGRYRDEEQGNRRDQERDGGRYRDRSPINRRHSDQNRDKRY